MAMFLSRIKKALNLGTKNITVNGTYNASSDGYDGYSSVEVNVPQITPTSITPSNSTPAALTANTPVTPTTAGYAVRSYDSITPSDSSPARMYEDSIYKTNSSGYAVSNVNNVTPSDYSPPYLYQNNIYKPQAHGYLYSSQQVTPTSITPSNSTPVALTALTPVNPMANGYAISSYSSKTPSDSSPASVSSGAIIKASASGYLYSTVQPKVKIGTFTYSTSSTTSINVGFKPKYLCIMSYGSDDTHVSVNSYNQDMSTTKNIRGGRNSSNMDARVITIPATSSSSYVGKLLSIDSNGFTVDKGGTSVGANAYYFAIG